MTTRSVSLLGIISCCVFSRGLHGQNYDASLRTPRQSVPMSNIVSTQDEGHLRGTVSVRQLQHRVPGNAAKEWDRAEKARTKGDVSTAVGHLRKAIENDPEFLAARNNLGAMLIAAGQPDEAIAQLKECLELDPHAPLPYANLAVALMMKEDFDGAEAIARRGLDLDRTGTRIRMILGLVLVMQDKFTDEALNSLLRAGKDFPQGALLSARVYAARGERDEAEAAIKGYLKSGDAAGEPLARQWLAALRSMERTASATQR